MTLQKKLGKRLRKIFDAIEAEPVPPTIQRVLDGMGPGPKTPAIVLREGALLQEVPFDPHRTKFVNK